MRKESNMQKYGIITPTFRGHFAFIKNYLKSFDYYVEDKENIEIYFTINAYEEKEFKKIIEPFKQKININVLIFDEILDSFGIYLTPDNLLKKYGKFSFQTLKKYYTMLYVNCNKMLVLDSESLWVRKTNMKELFENFFSNPRLFCSDIDKERISLFKLNVQKNIDYLLNCHHKLWFLENFMWYYDKAILENMVRDIGFPIEIVDKSRKQFPYNHDVFEILLYQNYIYNNLDRYGYKVVNVTEACRKKLSPKVWENYYFELTDRLHGDFGLLEQTMLLLNKTNVKEFIDLFKELEINILRCESGNNLIYQKEFFYIVQPYILAASQDHQFGIQRVGFCQKIKKYLYGLNFFSKEKAKAVFKKVDPAYKVACENRDYLFVNQKILNQLLENEKMRMSLENDSREPQELSQ